MKICIPKFVSVIFQHICFLCSVLFLLSCDPRTISALNNGSSAVSCIGNNCLAAGYYLKSPGAEFLPQVIQSRDAGVSFIHALEPPLPPGGTTGGLTGISCSGANNCIAVGFYQNSPTSDVFPLIVQSFDGGLTFTETTPAALPSGGVTGALVEVICKGFECYAVGYYQESSTGPTLPYVAVSIDKGKTFPHAIATALPTNGILGALLAITCAGEECIAVGYYRTSSTGAILPLIVQSKNKGRSFPFAVQPPMPTGGMVGQLVGVNCIDTDCTAVGFYQKERTPPPAHPLPLPYATHSFDAGKTFTTGFEPPMPSDGKLGSLNDVTCNQTKCIGVGAYQTTSPVGNFQPYTIQSFNKGRSFEKPVQPPQPSGALIGGLIGVTCTNTSCVSVGGYQKTTEDRRLPLVIQSADSGSSFTNAYQPPLPAGGVLGDIGVAILLSTE